MTQRVFLLQPAHHQLFPAISAMKKSRVAIHKVFAQEQQFSAFSVNQILLIKGKKRKNKTHPSKQNKANVKHKHKHTNKTLQGIKILEYLLKENKILKKKNNWEVDRKIMLL